MTDVSLHSERRSTLNRQRGSTQNEESWNVALRDEEALYLENWLDQRERMERYDGRDKIWLNQQRNPYDSGPLNGLLENLVDEAGIETGGWELGWYSFRHSVEIYVYEQYRDLEMVAEQFR